MFAKLPRKSDAEETKESTIVSNYRPPIFEQYPSVGGGITDYYRKNYSGADLSGNPSINLATGRFKYEFADLDIGNGKCAINVSHIYNSLASTKLTDKAKNIGAGWKLNLQQYIVGDGADSKFLREA